MYKILLNKYRKMWYLLLLNWLVLNISIKLSITWMEIDYN